MATIERFEQIEAWKAAREVTRAIYEVSGRGAFARDFGLRDQITQAAVSVMSNIAEGFESRTQALFIDFLGRAKGSAGEVRPVVCRSRCRLHPGGRIRPLDRTDRIVQPAHQPLHGLP